LPRDILELDDKDAIFDEYLGNIPSGHDASLPDDSRGDGCLGSNLVGGPCRPNIRQRLLRLVLLLEELHGALSEVRYLADLALNLSCVFAVETR
jgi:hypothetical protein